MMFNEMFGHEILYGGNSLVWVIMCVSAAILIVIGIVSLIRWIVSTSNTAVDIERNLNGDKKALEILNRRYAKGEISKEEFEQIKKDLK